MILGDKPLISKVVLSHSSSPVMSKNISSSSKERSTTGITSEDPPCSQTGEGSLHGDASDGDIGGGTDSDGDDDGVEALLEEDEEPLAEERKHLMALFSSIVHK
jgi:hypothetical protein